MRGIDVVGGAAAGFRFFSLGLGFLIGMVAGVFCLMAAGAHLFVLRPVGRAARVKVFFSLAVTPIVLLATWCLLAAEVPRQLMFRANKPAMDVWVQRFLKMPGGLPAGAQARVGFYTAYNIEPIPGGVKFLVAGAGFFRTGGGFAYSPGGAPSVSATGPGAWYTFKPIEGAWYLVTYDEP